MKSPDPKEPPAIATPAIEDVLIRALQDPALYAHPVKHFSVLETHISWVILTGEYAYKVKKPVDLGFVDFSTLAKREYYCTEELRLNQRFAPELYLQVVSIKGNRTHPRLNGDGKAIEYAVKMREFPQHSLLSCYASEHRLEAAHIDTMADVIAGFHRQAPPAEADTTFGSCDTFLKWSGENFKHIEAVLPEDIFPDGYDALKKWCLALDDALQITISERQANGYVRECHGDLHLGNIALIDGHITLFDCIEFNAELRWIDIISEVAFLAMDLQARGYQQFCWRLINRYLQITGDYSGLTLLRRYLVYRALVRAKVEALRVQQDNTAAINDSTSYEAVSTYLNLAQSWSTNNRPALVIMHGFSGSGKSTLAKQLVEALGAIQIRSDIERKRLFEINPADSSHSAPGEGIYTADASEQTYNHLAELARTIIQAGYTVIVDASFLKQSQRDQFTRLARQYHVPFALISCGAPVEVLRDRIKHRSAHENDPSEANLDVLQHQLKSHDALTREEQDLTIAPAASQTMLSAEQLLTLTRKITDHRPV